MSKKLTLNDYKLILQYYNIKENNKNKIINKAEDILATKLCRCIKKVTKKTKKENIAIGICRKSIFQNRGFDINSFNCKKKYTIRSKKKNKNLVKKKRNITMKYKRNIKSKKTK